MVEDFGKNRCFVKCKCGIEQGKLYWQKCDAIKRWNTRKGEPQTGTRTETQNSNSAFEKVECEITDCDYHDACKKRGQTDCQWK